MSTKGYRTGALGWRFGIPASCKRDEHRGIFPVVETTTPNHELTNVWLEHHLKKYLVQAIYYLRSRQPQVLLMAHAKILQWECQTKVLHPHLTQPKAETLAMAYCDLPIKPSANMYTSAMYLHTSAHKATCPRHSDCRLVDQEREDACAWVACGRTQGSRFPSNRWL